ncbi:hypothetical protein EUX98_g2659 [Antrodiella citrinella]|uniref:Uncharacterized protein n=1 Tax=Antrodiella citrinella TaxID=2447956 RepID=A0A4V3XJ34_9APHY|nr:hypothetical protein EUX98_g2659 [Antrodiella citrinella]
MQLGSTGTRAFLNGRQAYHFVPPGRSIHIPAYIPRATTKPVSSAAQAVFKRTRTLLTSFVSHLTAPGTTFSRPAGIPAVGRSLYPPATHARGIHNGLSFAVRYSLGRPTHLPYLPRAPAVPRNVAQVGLGTARSFSTGRPIFQSLADNVPIVGRALWEADMDIKIIEERARILPKSSTKALRPKGKEMLKARPVASVKETATKDDQKIELNQYFPIVEPEATTYLLIPLAPTPTNRLPLRDTPHLHTSATHPLLPFSLISSLHSDHATHSLRVSSLFARLDNAHVFDDSGVTCSAFGDPIGQCTVLEVKFNGWTEQRVRGVLGEAGMGWCVLEEVRREDEMQEQADMEDMLSAMSSTRASSPAPVHQDIDPSSSFVLPTLDFSSSFPVQSDVWVPRPSTPLSDLTFHNEWSSSVRHSESDSDSDHVSTLSSGSLSRSSSIGSDSLMGLGFSSQFASRVARSEVSDWSEPKESFF